MTGVRLDDRPARLSTRIAVGLLLSACVILLAATGHEPSDNGRTPTPVAVNR